MAVIKKKIHPQYFDLVARGKKKFEFRIADFGVKEGDVLALEEWDPETKKHTGRSLIKKVGYVKKFTLEELEQEFGQQRELIEQHGFYIIQLE